MLKKQADFDNWVKKITQTWRQNADSLKGKQAKRNLGALAIILEATEFIGGPFSGISTWDVALKYLKLTQPTFNSWSSDRVFHERQKENAQMNRRLRFLADKRYIIKNGSKYKISGKGMLVWFFFDIKFVAEAVYGDYRNDPEVAKDPELLRIISFFTQEDRCEAFSTFIKLRLQKYAVNLDDISPEALVEFLISDVKRVNESELSEDKAFLLRLFFI
jgi:hypothetical protein